jgi:PPM family protein phosphatase
MNIELGAVSETGYVRKENQDRMAEAAVALGRLYIVADGMGGHKAGGLAAEMTVGGLQKYIAEAGAKASIEAVIKTAFQRVNQEIYRKSYAGNPDIEGMGSTALVLLIADRIARLAHVGDSRAYLYRERSLQQLTEDHTLVQKMVNAGLLAPEKAAGHPDAALLSQAMGSSPDVEVEISTPLEIKTGDCILLCSDGLSGFVSDVEIAQVLESWFAAQEAARKLVDLALMKGGKDNITVQVIQCCGGVEKKQPGSGAAKKQPFVY